MRGGWVSQGYLAAAALIVAGELFFATMGVGVRIAAQEHGLPNEMVVFLRNLLGMLLLMPWWLRSSSGGLATEVPLLHLLRGVAGVSAMYCFFYAIAHLPMADAMLLKLTAPLFIPLIAWSWLGERVGVGIAMAVGIGFAGVLLVLRPGFEGISTVALIGLMGGALAAVAKVTVRRLARSEPPPRIVLYFAGIGTLISAVPLAWAWQTPTPEVLRWILLVALAATAGQLCLSFGLSLAPASRIGAFGYFSVVFGAGYGWLLWDEIPAWSTAVGSALILVAGLILMRRGRRPAAGLVVSSKVQSSS